MTELVAVIPCSGAKAPMPPGIYAVPARQLYIGSFHVLARTHAERVADRVLVLSADRGLIRLDTPVATYDKTFGRPGTVTAPEILRQAARFRLLDDDVVVASILPGRYRSALAGVVPGIVDTLAGCRGIGQQRARVVRLDRDTLLAAATEHAENTPERRRTAI